MFFRKNMEEKVKNSNKNIKKRYINKLKKCMYNKKMILNNYQKNF